MAKSIVGGKLCIIFPRTGKTSLLNGEVMFFNVDLLFENYAYQSHYNFSENIVIDARERKGLEAK